ncbi:MAG: hypothetical protein VKJ87_06230 [Synechococcus sp.]|nr:hypothetical protein [Synechococcus sp.]
MAQLLTAALLLLLGATVGSGVIRSHYGQQHPLEQQSTTMPSGRHAFRAGHP